RIVEKGKEGNPKAVGELPRGSFELRIADLFRNEKANDAGLARLKDCKELTHLYLHSTPVGDAGLAHLGGCQNLVLLTLQATKVTAQGIAEFKKVVPNCKIEWDGATTGPNSPDLGRWTRDTAPPKDLFPGELLVNEP